jgi:hypothetical protein
MFFRPIEYFQFLSLKVTGIKFNWFIFWHDQYERETAVKFVGTNCGGSEVCKEGERSRRRGYSKRWKWRMDRRMQGGRADWWVLGRYQDDGPSPQYTVFCPCHAQLLARRNNPILYMDPHNN